MAYADQQGMSKNRMIAIIVVLLLHAFLGYALVTGLAFEAVQKVKEKLNVVDVKEEKPPEEEPPPPPEDIIEPPPEVVVPPIPNPPPTKNTLQQKSQDLDQKVDNTPKYTPCPDGSQVPVGTVCKQKEAEKYRCPVSGAIVEQQSQCPPIQTCWNGTQILASAKCPPEPPKGETRAGSPRGNPGSWATTSDYPQRALNQEREGTTGFRVSYDANGRITDCQITSSSGHADLDAATCSNVKRRGKFNPGLKDGVPVGGSYSNKIRWQIPKD